LRLLLGTHHGGGPEAAQGGRVLKPH
jgi:hypothetical protein